MVLASRSPESTVTSGVARVALVLGYAVDVCLFFLHYHIAHPTIPEVDESDSGKEKTNRRVAAKTGLNGVFRRDFPTTGDAQEEGKGKRRTTAKTVLKGIESDEFPALTTFN
ncbi:hypothetical protein F52700_9769 [Fusarium sp. NRRL 52700]|nr:hypothetical protein F52700_9769 [Fusarium sp. NRRL 52700]